MGEIIRLYGKTRYGTAVAVANELKLISGVSKFDNIVIACGTKFPDALCGSCLAVRKNAPILLLNPVVDVNTGEETSHTKSINDKVRQYINDNLKENGTIYILGGTAAIPEVCIKELKTSFNVKRLYGKNRYYTALEVLKEAGITNEDILIASGTVAADSTSAAASGLPIVIVNNDADDWTQVSDGNNPASLLDYLIKHSINDFYVLGGDAAIKQKFYNSILVECKGGDSKKLPRVKGKNRYYTSLEIARNFFIAPSKVAIVYGEDFPDCLSAGPMCYTLGIPALLTKSYKNSGAVDTATPQVTRQYTEEHNISSGYVIGGSAVITNESINIIFSNPTIVSKYIEF